jgi:hypothetical protein
VYVPTRRYDEADGSTTIKNSVDVRLATDCIELIHTHPGIEVFILATGDSDFIHVVNKLRPYGKRVVGLAVSWSASPRLAEVVDELVLYDRDIEPPPEQLLRTSPPPAEPARAEPPLAAATIAAAEGLDEDEVTKVVSAIQRVVDTYRDAERPLNTSVLGVELRNALGDGDFRMLVRGRVQQFVRAMARAGALQVIQRGVDDWLYRVGEDVSPRTEARAEPLRAEPRYGTRVAWLDLDPALRDRAIATVVELEADPRLDWLVFIRIAAQLEGLDVDLTGRELANAMREGGILLPDEQKQWYDALTGKTGEYWTLQLNDDHEEVIRLRGER